MVRRYQRNPLLHRHYSARLLELVAGEMLGLLAEPCDPREAAAAAGQLLPAGPGWHSWASLLPHLASRLDALLGPSAHRRGLCADVAFRLAESGRVDVVAEPFGRRRGRIRFARLALPGAPASVVPPPRPAGLGSYRPYSVGRLALVSELLLRVLARPCPHLELLAYAPTRTPPPGEGWRAWPWVTAKFFEAAACVLASKRKAMVSDAGWLLAGRGLIQLATTPMTCRGLPRKRIRFARLGRPQAANAPSGVPDSAGGVA